VVVTYNIFYNTVKPRMVCFEEGRNDEDMNCLDTTIQADDKVSSFICTFGNSKNRLLPNVINLIRNHGEDYKVHE
jgi:hypothetical protein